ncbi:MarR family winged helix-turn-helix transcriptional regulator [Burkholderia gladioli]|uniref:MarR family winged helix-turn-helix transcriptional regulator n=1 Tax=Burkholderia gladioli TaxID=28095 RepID=UPI0020B3D9B9|nr:MarR family transcriptional regulator [Burkholderia gladioli]MDN7722055.1 MarR family transcriptional regulator [Burkholderia gladioli]
MDTSTNLDGRCNCLAARKASRYLSALYDGALSQVGLRATQFSILHKLRAGGPLAMGELATVMAMDRTTLSTNLKPLERDGLLAIRPGEDDRRRKAISITAASASIARRCRSGSRCRMPSNGPMASSARPVCGARSRRC